MKTTVVISEDGLFASEPMTVTALADMCCAAITSIVKEVQKNYADDPDQAKIDKELFDCLNLSFSKCLENSFPEYELHPEITEEVLHEEEMLVAKKLEEQLKEEEGESYVS